MPAATPLRVWWDNLADATATAVSASEAATGFPASNIQSTFRQVRWRSLNVTGAKTVTVDLGSAKDITVVGVLDHNLTSNATVTVHSSADNFATSSWVADLVTSRLDEDGTTIKLNPIVAYVEFTTARYWRFTIADATNADGYIEMGRVFLGLFTEMTKNYATGWGIEPVDLSRVQRSLNGVVHINKKPQYRMVDVNFALIGAAQKDALRKVADTIGTHTAAWFDVSPDSLAHDLYVIYGRLTKIPKMVNARWNLWNQQVTIEEDL